MVLTWISSSAPAFGASTPRLAVATNPKKRWPIRSLMPLVLAFINTILLRQLPTWYWATFGRLQSPLHRLIYKTMPLPTTTDSHEKSFLILRSHQMQLTLFSKTSVDAIRKLADKTLDEQYSIIHLGKTSDPHRGVGTSQVGPGYPNHFFLQISLWFMHQYESIVFSGYGYQFKKYVIQLTEPSYTSTTALSILIKNSLSSFKEFSWP